MPVNDWKGEGINGSTNISIGGFGLSIIGCLAQKKIGKNEDAALEEQVGLRQGKNKSY